MIPYPPLATSTYPGLVQFPLTTAQGGLGANNSASTGVPVLASGVNTIRDWLDQSVKQGASPTFVAANLSSTLTNSCATQLCMDFSRSGSGNLEFRLFNPNTANYVILNFGEVSGSKQGSMYYFGAGYSPSSQYLANELLIECITSGGVLGLSYPSNGTFQIFAQSGTPVVHGDSSGNFTWGASTHSLARIEARLTSASQFAASYDASNYETTRVSSSGTCTRTLAGTNAGHDFKTTGTGGLSVNTGSQIRKLLTATASLDFSSIAANTTGELTITVTGAAVGDDVTVTPNGTPESGLVWSGYVSATNTVTVRLGNVTTGAIDPASRTWRATVRNF